MRETHQVCRGGCLNDDTFHNFDFANPELIHCKYRPFHKLVKDIISPSKFTPLTTITLGCTPMLYHSNSQHGFGPNASLPSCIL